MSFMSKSNTEQNTRNSPLDDWENVTEELQLAQISERQKQIVQRQLEEQQDKLPCSSSTQDDHFPASANPMRPIRLLRRAENAQTKIDNSEENQAKLLTLEERQAAYQQARERIFGVSQPVNIQSSSLVQEEKASKNLAKAVLEALVSDKNGNDNSQTTSTTQPPTQSDALKQTSNDPDTVSEIDNGLSEAEKQVQHNYLSDVQMVTTETAPLSNRRHHTRHTKPTLSTGSKPLTYGMPPPVPPGPFPSAMAILVQQAYAPPPPQGQPITQPMCVPPRPAPQPANNQGGQQQTNFSSASIFPLANCNPAMPPVQIRNDQRNVNTVEISVPRSVVGSVIGKKGGTIQRLAYESGARIQFAQDKDPSSAARQLIVQGSSDQIGRARHVISAFISTCSHGTENSDAESFFLSVPANKAGLVIGKGGDTIKQICAETGAHVELNRDISPNANVKVFLIKGTFQQIQYAQHVIKQKIGELSPNGSVPTSSAPMPGPAYVLPAAQQQYQFGAPHTAPWAQSNGQNATPWATQYIQQPQQQQHPLTPQHQEHTGQPYYEFSYM